MTASDVSGQTGDASAAGTEARRGTSIVVQSTTSTANSGLYSYLLPLFEASSGIRVDVVAVGTGQAIRNAKNCDGDLLVVHARKAEDAFVAEGFGSQRHDLMYNDFVIIGPEDDPAAIGEAKSVADALARIAGAAADGAVFVSRGDDSGTHKKEMALWADADIDTGAASGRWYRETGSGMGATLNIAIGMNAYTLSDRASWIAFGNKGDHRVLFEGDDALFNQYGVVTINPEACPEVNHAAAGIFADWLLSEAGQRAIAEYRVDGKQLFFPNASGEPTDGE
ncbi:MAG: sulfate transporter [Gammaproteobacteria bacterium]|nr:MAG: sulfate transporter [Gammaproteobacteria bacterium]